MLAAPMNPPKVERVLNGDNEKMLLHGEELANYLHERQHGLIAMEVDLSLACNHKCPECTFGDYLQKVFLPDEVFEKILKSLPEIGVKGIILTGGGEPCVHKRLGEFVRRCHEAGVKTTLTTNGCLLYTSDAADE